ncbi:hypothetical protein [Deminuibacter soli]|uniref:Uncharacterized protein n=1 Tax=Deminuibacter soli TaxID=2291815 RepID=A0A3E1NCZ6_9BACT|nr:hypothetical protein [Deminuibacter soli]RFM25823.1 hypothetical protein DXN05_22960 [Deminuibacter soli]
MNLELLVIECCNNLISRYGFEVKSEGKSGKTVFLFNQKCILKFIYDYGDIGCNIVDPIDKIKSDALSKNGKVLIGYPMYPAWAGTNLPQRFK